MLTDYLAGHNDLALIQVYESPAVRQAVGDSPVWVGPLHRPVPDLESIVKLAEVLRARTIVMVLVRRAPYGKNEPTPIRLYVVDAWERRVYQQDGMVSEISELADVVFAQWRQNI